MNHSGRNHNRSAFLAAVLARAFPEASVAAVERAVFEMQRAARRAEGGGDATGDWPSADLEGAQRVALRATRALEPGVFQLQFAPDGSTVLHVPGLRGELPGGGFAVYR